MCHDDCSSRHSETPLPVQSLSPRTPQSQALRKAFRPVTDRVIEQALLAVWKFGFRTKTRSDVLDAILHLHEDTPETNTVFHRVIRKSLGFAELPDS